MPIDRNEVEQIAGAWIDLHQSVENSPEWESLFWVFGRVYDLIQDDAEMAWEVIETIRRQDGSDLILSNLAAGPFEDFLVAHGEHFIDRIEAAAGNDPQLQRMLGATWQNDIPDELWTRIQDVAGSSW